MIKTYGFAIEMKHERFRNRIWHQHFNNKIYSSKLIALNAIENMKNSTDYSGYEWRIIELFTLSYEN